MIGGPTALPATGALLAIDYGEKRIGLALSNPEQTLARPLATLTRRAGRRFPMKQLQQYLEEHAPIGVVVGLPLTQEGDENEQTAAARAVGALIATKTGLPACFWDERMTTARALSAVSDLRGSTRKRKGDVDPLAATVLLQNFLDSRR